MLKPAATPLTVCDYRLLPEGPPYYQLVEGDLFIAPPPDLYHQDIVGNLFFLVRSYLQKRPVGTIHLAPSDVQLSDLNVYQPDLYFVSTGRKSILQRQGAVGAPDLVVEVLSPKTARLDKGIKRSVYARTGVEELWLVDPDRKEVEIYRLGEAADTPSSICRLGRIVESPLFPGLKIPVAKLFRR